MKLYFLISLIFLFGTINSNAQFQIKGKITSIKNEPLEGASIYLNNTTIGTISNEDGEFQLKVNKGSYDLVISFLGYKTSQRNININTSINFSTIKLLPESNILDEIVIQKTIYNNDWHYNLSRFKQAFLGRTKLAKECVIMNPKILHFDYNSKTNTLTASARAPLKIKHKGLGYLINYDLVDFTIERNMLFFSGYSKYENLKKTVRKKWKKNRLVAYNGSQVHFLQSLIKEKVKEEGFIVNQFKRVLNPERPTEEKIKMAKELVKLSRVTSFNVSEEITNPTSPLDSALVIIQKSKKPKFISYLYNTNVAYKDMISFDNAIPSLDFENHLSIIYTNEPEEKNYVIGTFGQKRKTLEVQTSNINLIDGKAIIDPKGVLIEPNAIFNEGYWGFESFANMLPLDYQPPID